MPTMSRRKAASGSSCILVISVPANAMRPLVRVSRPAITINRLVLPAPLGPKTPTVSPAPICKLMPFRILTFAAAVPRVRCAALRSITAGSIVAGSFAALDDDAMKLVQSLIVVPAIWAGGSLIICPLWKNRLVSPTCR